MSRTGFMRSVLACTLVLVALLVSTQIGTAQARAVIGQASAMRATISGLGGPTTSELASTGSLVDYTDARQASALSGAIPSLATAEVLRASAISSISTWSPQEQVESGASLADLALTIAGTRISAGFAIARALATVGGSSTGDSAVEALAVNGVPIVPNGTVNQTVSVPGVRLVINEVVRSASGITVSALHITSLDGVIDVVVATATAGIP